MLYRVPPVMNDILNTVCGLPGIMALGLLMNIGMGLTLARITPLEASLTGTEQPARNLIVTGCDHITVSRLPSFFSR
jgi:hypothetical protein